jgi:guanine deaminase
MNNQEKFMQRAINLSRKSVKLGGGPFGAVIVKNGEIIAEASNGVTKNNDPTGHAEINAIRKAAKELQNFDLNGCEIYSSCEPCPMCLGAIYWAGLDQLYFANTKEDAAQIQFDDQFIYEEIEKPFQERRLITKQIMRNEAIKAFQDWEDLESKIRY